MLLEALPFDPGTGAPRNRAPSYAWTLALEGFDDKLLGAVELVLGTCAAHIELLAALPDRFGRSSINQATPRCRAAISRHLYLFGRYELRAGPPEHMSATSVVRYAVDHGDPVAALARDSGAPKVAPRAVVIKLMRNRDQFEREVRARLGPEAQRARGSDGGLLSGRALMDAFAEATAAAAACTASSSAAALAIAGEGVAQPHAPLASPPAVLPLHRVASAFDVEPPSASARGPRGDAPCDTPKTPAGTVATPRPALMASLSQAEPVPHPAQTPSLATASSSHDPPTPSPLPLPQQPPAAAATAGTTGLAALSPAFVVPILRVHHPDVDASVRAELASRQLDSHPFVLVLPAADRALNAIIDHEREMAGWMEEARLVARQLGSALAYLHERGIVHGDVKPRNVVRDGRVYKLIDLDAGEHGARTAGV